MKEVDFFWNTRRDFIYCKAHEKFVFLNLEFQYVTLQKFGLPVFFWNYIKLKLDLSL